MFIVALVPYVCYLLMIQLPIEVLLQAAGWRAPCFQAVLKS
jgi:hypothetical protein